ncbi:MAG: DUF1576 domain-containing protein [Clostridia bacterium]|nr:DUF1576 domain-containing protein [Clostridia bacterium]
MSDLRHDINQAIRKVCFFFSVCLLLASAAAAVYLQETPAQVIAAWGQILISPCPLVTDYFRVGSLSAAFLNAALCGFACSMLTLWPGAKHKPNVWAGYFLIIAHCFYGLNFVNMWPPMLGFLVYCRMHRLRFRDNLDWAMFITSFSPFVSELLFRYPVAVHWDVTLFGFTLNLFSVLLALLLSLFLGVTLPAMLPGATKLHRGYNLYNGGLATGLLGLFVFAFMFKTMGVPQPEPVTADNAVYAAHGNSYALFCTVFFLIVFSCCLIYGWYQNGKTFRGYGALLRDSGYKTNFLKKYGAGVTWMNLGIYGMMMVAYFNLVILFTDGAGFTGATCGIVLAAMTFSASGQHPRNVWPILLGYVVLNIVVMVCTLAVDAQIPWTLSTQGYMNGIAFATGLCPFTGKYGRKVGVLAGFISAVMCTTVGVMHGGFVLYNGGLNAGITALILLPLCDTYLEHKERWGRGHKHNVTVTGSEDAEAFMENVQK